MHRMDGESQLPKVLKGKHSVAEHSSSNCSDSNDHDIEEEGTIDDLISILVVHLDYTLIYNRTSGNALDPSNLSLCHDSNKSSNAPEPVIRVFGATDAGQRVCAHVHGVYPYLFFRPDDMNHVAFRSEPKIRMLIPQLESTIEELMHVRRCLRASELGNDTTHFKRKHIKELVPVQRKTIYGMYMEPFWFIKAILYNPIDIMQLGMLLQETQVMSISMQSYESHIPYLLKFTSDRNISPMGWMHIKTCKFRWPLPSSADIPQVGASSASADTVSQVIIHNDAEVMKTPEDAVVKETLPPSLARRSNRHAAFMSPTSNVKQESFSSPFVELSQHRNLQYFQSPVRQSSSMTASRTHNLDLNQKLQQQLEQSTQHSESSRSEASSCPRFFTSSNVPTELLWQFDTHECDETHRDLKDTLSSQELAALLDGITAEDLIVSPSLQPQPQDQAPDGTCDASHQSEDGDRGNESLALASEMKHEEKHNLLGSIKLSTCELEIDLLGDDILNQQMPKKSFGEELWEEEARRCKRKGLEKDIAATPPFTPTMHRIPEPVELEFRDRLSNLMKKGIAFKKRDMNHHSLSSKGNQNQSSSHKPFPGASVEALGSTENVINRVPSFRMIETSPIREHLSESNDRDTGFVEESATDEHTVPIEQWVSTQIQVAATNASMQEALLNSTINIDIHAEGAYSNEEVEQYVEKSQILLSSHSQHSNSNSFSFIQIHSQHPVDESNADDGFVSSDEEGGCHSTSHILRETQDILRSTQVADIDRLTDESLEEKKRFPVASASRSSVSPPTAIAINDAVDTSTAAEKDMNSSPESENDEIFSRSFYITLAQKRMKEKRKSSIERKGGAAHVASNSEHESTATDTAPASLTAPLRRTKNSQNKREYKELKRINKISDVFKGRKNRNMSPTFTLENRQKIENGSDSRAHINTSDMKFAVKKVEDNSPFGRLVSSEENVKSNAASLSPVAQTHNVTISTSAGGQANRSSSIASSSEMIVHYTELEDGHDVSRKRKRSLSSIFKVRKRTTPLSVSFALPPDPSDEAPTLNPPVYSNVRSSVLSVSDDREQNQVKGNIAGQFFPETNETNLESAKQADKFVQENFIGRRRAKRTVSFLDTEAIQEEMEEISKADGILEQDVSLKESNIEAAHCDAFMYLLPTYSAPTIATLSPLSAHNLPEVINRCAFMSRAEDVPHVRRQSSCKGREQPAVGSSAFFASLHQVPHISELTPAFDGGRKASLAITKCETSSKLSLKGREQFDAEKSRLRCLLPTFLPPHPALMWRSTSDADSQRNDVKKGSKTKATKELGAISQICSPTQTQHSTRSVSQDSISAKSKSTNKMSRSTILSLEIHCNGQGELLPNYKYDEVQVIVWVVDDIIGNAENESNHRMSGIICQLEDQSNGNFARALLREKRFLKSCGLPNSCYAEVVRTERQLFEAVIELIRRLDPDFLVGYDLLSRSFGYLIKRAKVLQIDLLKQLSRLPTERPSFKNNFDRSEDLAVDPDGDIYIAGRIVLTVWKLMQSELKLFNYSRSNVAAHLLNVRIPHFSSAQLSRWYQSQHSTRARTIRHVYMLADVNLKLLTATDHFRRTSECARLYGIDYNSVLTRGSQYRVEAAMLQAAHARNFILISPSRNSVAAQAPMEVIPLVMEPRSQFYHDPVLVLDFQSLYPSMMIAYNLCFSTCMGKLKPGTVARGAGVTGVAAGVDTTERLGVIRYPEIVTACNSVDHIPLTNNKSVFQESNEECHHSSPPYVSPNGSVFCSKEVRQGILPKMVKAMLDTRIMVKRSMKRHKDPASAVLRKVLDARQLAIKMLSNVTYGYTAAGFSGRMPMAELADAIVQSGRSTLEWTVRVIEEHPDWQAKVVYGDTDSVFVHLPGRSLVTAFNIGQQIAQYITEKSPADVLLKFEKVYHPCILVSKKRYVGYMYETMEDIVANKPHLEAKGIEVARRDQCPATVKIQEKALRILFESKDLSAVKQYLSMEWDKMLQGGDKLTLRDFIFSKEVRFGRYASVSSQPPGAIVATKAVLRDEMAVPPYNWRVPYAVVHGMPNAPLKNLVFAPEEIIRRGSALRVNYTYYICKCINPALDRVLSLCGADVFSWFKALTRPKLRLRHINYDNYDSNRISKASDAPCAAEGLIERRRGKKQISMDQFTIQGSCEVCGADSEPRSNLCFSCSSEKRTASYLILVNRFKHREAQELQLREICGKCAQVPQPNELFAKHEMIGKDCCESLDCPVFFERARLVTRLEDCTLAVTELL